MNFVILQKFQIVQITNQECSKNSCVLSVTEIFEGENFLGGMVRSECQISESLTWGITRDLQNRELCNFTKVPDCTNHESRV